MKKKHVVLIVIAILAVAGGAFAYSKRGPKPTEVEVATVAREDIQAKVTANGKVQATKKVDISATIPGQITMLAVKEGDRVAKGQLLLHDRRRQPPRRRPQQRVLDAGAAPGPAVRQREPGPGPHRPAPGGGELRRPHHSRGRDPARPHRRLHRGGGGPRVRPPRGAGARHARRLPRHAGQDPGRARRWTGSSPPSGSRKARSRSSASRTAPAPCSSRSPTCPSSRPSSRWTRRRSRR